MYQSLHPEYQLAEIRERHALIRRQAAIADLGPLVLGVQ